MSSTMRVVLGIGVVVVAVVLLVVLRDGGDGGSSGGGASTTATTGTSPERPGAAPSEPSEPAAPTIVIRNGEPVGGVAELSAAEGERVRFVVRSDVGDEVHLHGYDISKDVEPGDPASFDFPATIEGVFEAELEGRGVQILELRVNP